MRGRDFKDALFEQFARIAAAFASPKRIEIIDVLAQGERNVATLARETSLSMANTSRHLQILKAVNLVVSSKHGLQVVYRLADPLVLDSYRAFRSLAEARLAEVDRLVHDYFTSADGLEPVSRQELLRRIRRHDVVVLDVRPLEEYAAGHIAGALSLPLAALRRRLADVPASRKIVAYCRGPYCVLAAEAVRLLRQRGFDAVRLSEGYPEWRDAGLPITNTSERRTRAKETRL
jgi:rhodanese-related sulfurtransferase/DNA-binding transcriptional ArsR family regulator